jgi:hypothetical protein
MIWGNTPNDLGKGVIQSIPKFGGLDRSGLQETTVSKFVIDQKKTSPKNKHQPSESHGACSASHARERRAIQSQAAEIDLN